jgi:hypothetical protein
MALGRSDPRGELQSTSRDPHRGRRHNRRDQSDRHCALRSDRPKRATHLTTGRGGRRAGQVHARRHRPRIGPAPLHEHRPDTPGNRGARGGGASPGSRAPDRVLTSQHDIYEFTARRLAGDRLVHISWTRRTWAS